VVAIAHNRGSSDNEAGAARQEGFVSGESGERKIKRPGHMGSSR
jgi:hypothetical protein